jgi:hypothetical protein
MSWLTRYLVLIWIELLIFVLIDRTHWFRSFSRLLHNLHSRDVSSQASSLTWFDSRNAQVLRDCYRFISDLLYDKWSDVLIDNSVYVERMSDKSIIQVHSEKVEKNQINHYTELFIWSEILSCRSQLSHQRIWKFSFNQTDKKRKTILFYY